MRVRERPGWEAGVDGADVRRGRTAGAEVASVSTRAGGADVRRGRKARAGGYGSFAALVQNAVKAAQAGPVSAKSWAMRV